MRYLIVIYTVSIILLYACKADTKFVNQEGNTSIRFELKSGDLLFQDSDCGPFCAAIEKVTTGYQGYQFSHIGLVKITDQQAFVIEAISVGVVHTPIDSFLSRSYDENGKSKVIVGRLNDSISWLIPEVLTFVEKQKGKAYDDVFDASNDKYYCSELIYDAFLFANDSIPIFELQPMTFIDPDTEETFPIWTNYFNALDSPIPEGELGINPGGISRSNKVSIVHKYGNPSIAQKTTLK